MIKFHFHFLLLLLLYSVDGVTQVARPLKRPPTNKHCLDFARSHSFIGMDQLLTDPEITDTRIDLFFMSGAYYTREALAEKGRNAIPTNKLAALIPEYSDGSLNTKDIEDITSLALNHYFEGMLGEKVNMITKISLDYDFWGGDTMIDQPLQAAVGRSFGTVVFTAKNAYDTYSKNSFWPRQGDVFLDEDENSDLGECFVEGSHDDWKIQFAVNCDYDHELNVSQKDQFRLDIARAHDQLYNACAVDFSAKGLSLGAVKIPRVQQRFEFDKNTQMVRCENDECIYN